MNQEKKSGTPSQETSFLGNGARIEDCEPYQDAQSGQPGQKGRKRRFVRRTKTGCVTCRRRKKKCDESKPQCDNCLHGGFACAGYQQKHPMPTTAAEQSLVTLEPKVDCGNFVYSYPASYTTMNLGDAVGLRRPLPDYRRQIFRVDGHFDGPDTCTATKYTRSDGPVLPQVPRPEISSPSLYGTIQAAQLSNLESSARSRTQKEEMIAGHYYSHSDQELTLERERCDVACWNFNNSANPKKAVTVEGRIHLLRAIFYPNGHDTTSTQASALGSRMGRNVVIEAPFYCDYGYNVSIGHDVSIGRNCTILDGCEVRIDDRCNIGPTVNIYTTTLSVDPERRLGSRGTSFGRKITIESDCWIGGGVTILPGLKIGKGSTVGAGSVVTKNVPPYSIMCGNPARLIRGLYSNQYKARSNSR